MLTGDLNACTSTNLDFVLLDNAIHLPLPTDYTADSEIPRSSQDTVLNEYGRQLLNLCLATRLRILNGRTGQDRNIGRYTCHTARGSTIVDYVITAAALKQYISQLVVSDLYLYSDHCPLCFKISGTTCDTFTLRCISNSAFGQAQRLY